MATLKDNITSVFLKSLTCFDNAEPLMKKVMNTKKILDILELLENTILEELATELGEKEKRRMMTGELVHKLTSINIVYDEIEDYDTLVSVYEMFINDNVPKAINGSVLLLYTGVYYYSKNDSLFFLHDNYDK